MPSKPKRVGVFSSVNWNRVGLFFCPVAVAIAIRVLGAVWLFQVLSPGGTFHTPWMDSNPSMIPARWNWLWLFNAWDSLQFTRIAMFGYVHPNYVYLPGYPIFILFAGWLIGDDWLGAFLVTQIFALGSIVVFQLVAEQYMKPEEALYASLLMSAFPFISVFTTLSYSEPVFLFSTLATWYFYKKGRFRSSSVLAALASVTRIYGLAIILPMLFDIVKLKRYRRLYFLTAPAASLCSWLLYCYLLTGDWFVSWTDERYWQRGGVGDGIKIFQAIFQHGVQGLVSCCAGLDPTIFWALSLFVILVVICWRVDRSLWIYAVTVSGLLVFTTTYYVSLLRYLAFIFPLWLGIRVRNPLVVAVCILALVPMIMIVWLYTIAVTFVG